MANFALFQQAPQVQSPDFNQSNMAGGMQSDAAQMAKQQAQGLGVSPADLQMRAGLMQAQKAAAAQRVSTRGNFGLAGAQRAAQTTQAGLQQNVINQGAQLRAQEQDRALQTYLAAASQKRASDLQAAGLSTQEAIAQANLEQQANAANQGMTAKLFGAGLGAVEGGLTGGMMFSDERAKQEAYVQGAREGTRQLFNQTGMGRMVPGPIDMGNGEQLAPQPNGQWDYQPAPQTAPDAGPRVASSAAAVPQQKASRYTMYDPQTGRPTHPTGTSLEAFTNLVGVHPSAPQPAQQPAPEPMQESSDRRAKQPQGGAHNAAQAFMDTLEPHAFTWADKSVAPNPQAAESPNLGVYAQDVERSPWGEAIVHDDPQTGYKQLDMRALVGALAASAGETHRQQQAHDQRLAALEAAVKGRR